MTESCPIAVPTLLPRKHGQKATFRPIFPKTVELSLETLPRISPLMVDRSDTFKLKPVESAKKPTRTKPAAPPPDIGAGIGIGGVF